MRGEEIMTVPLDGYFETMAFHSLSEDMKYHDADVSRQVFFDSKWTVDEKYADDKANDMHENVVAELIKKLENNLITS